MIEGNEVRTLFNLARLSCGFNIRGISVLVGVAFYFTPDISIHISYSVPLVKKVIPMCHSNMILKACLETRTETAPESFKILTGKI